MDGVNLIQKFHSYEQDHFQQFLVQGGTVFHHKKKTEILTAFGKYSTGETSCNLTDLARLSAIFVSSLKMPNPTHETHLI